jgi:hypothetical protein
VVHERHGLVLIVRDFQNIELLAVRADGVFDDVVVVRLAGTGVELSVNNPALVL